jgi:hypothetical protein
VVRLQCDTRRPGEPQIVPPGGAGEQIVPQGERTEEAALHAVQDGWEMVGAEDGGGGGEFRGGRAGGGGRGEVAGVGDEGGEDVENSPDAPRDGAGFRVCWGGWGCSGHGFVGSGFRGTKQEFYDLIPNTVVCGVGVWRRIKGLGWGDDLDHPGRATNLALIRDIRRGGFGCDFAFVRKAETNLRFRPGLAGRDGRLLGRWSKNLPYADFRLPTADDPQRTSLEVPVWARRGRERNGRFDRLNLESRHMHQISALRTPQATPILRVAQKARLLYGGLCGYLLGG